MEAGASIGVEDGRPVVRRRVDAVDRDRLRRTAAQLERAAHPGVVRLVASRPWRDGWELVTEHGGLPVGAAGLDDPAGVAALGAAVASTLADLHERGVVHGRLDASRILIGRGGRPLLCGFLPPDPSGHVGPDPPDDVAALGRVLRELADPMGPSAVTSRSALTAALMGAEATPPSRRPTARRLATELGALGPAARPSPMRVTDRPAHRHRPGHRWHTGRAVAVGLLVVAVGAVVLRGAGRRSTDAPPVTSTAPPEETTTIAPRCVATEGASVAADACGHDVRVQGARVVVDGRTYVVGVDGDVVAVADWDCAGGLRAVVLRPATGEVRVFGAFTADRVLSVARAVRAEAEPPVDSLGIREERGCPTIGILPGPTEAGPADQP